MSERTIRVETDERGVARLILDRPDKHNAMNPQLMDELAQAVDTLAADDAVRAVVLMGEGKSFSAGADLNWMKAQFEASREQRMTEARRLAHLLRSMNELPKPLIGRIHGNAFGGGMGLMAVCDVAIGAEGAKFGFTETRLGIVPATISPFVVARMGEGRARRVFMSARLFDAEEAVTLGLLARAVPPEALDEAVEAEVAPYLKVSTEAVAASKALARRLGPPITDVQIEQSVTSLADAWETPQAQAGIGAFFEKKAPPWDAS